MLLTTVLYTKCLWIPQVLQLSPACGRVLIMGAMAGSLCAHSPNLSCAPDYFCLADHWSRRDLPVSVRDGIFSCLHQPQLLSPLVTQTIRVPNVYAFSFI